ncbi:hypothetical protein EOM39_05040 [Candidatus Gracilibacteria bacterium]|nr:hypothetical protein [Candidatus Gracilibacteria bacterium]
MNNRFSYNSRRNKVKKTIKDYLIPIVGIFIVLLILFSVFSGDDTETTKEETNTEVSATDLVVKLDDALSEAYIMNEKDEKQAISSSSKLNPLEKLVVKEGSTTIENSSIGTMKLNKMGELESDKKGVLKLNSSDLWIEAKKSFSIETMYSKIKISAGSVISISQNEALSTVYVISGSAEVSNLVGKKTLLGNLQKLTISNQDASNDEVDLTLSKDNIDEFFKSSEWYTKNNGDSFLSGSLLSSSGATGSTMSGNLLDSTLTLTDLRDEMVLSSSKLSISGQYSNDFVSYITLDGVKAKIDTENKTFSFGTYTLTKKENDLVFKIYDTDGDVMSKVVYTFYYNGAIIQDETTTQVNDTPKVVETSRNYPIDGSKFVFTAPGTSPYTTTETFVTIRGQTPAGVSKVVVNGHQLSSFNGSTWRYHANADSDNFKDGTNVYEVKYYGDNGKLVYTNSYVIIKKQKIVELPAEEKTVSE